MGTLGPDDIKQALVRCFELQTEDTAVWHDEQSARFRLDGRAPGLDLLKDVVRAQHLVNFRLWHVEDRARVRDAGDAPIASAKREIDALNQERNDLIEQIDRTIMTLAGPLLPKDAPDRYNTETVGAAVDRMSILSLKIFHMAGRADTADEELARECRQKAEILTRQRQDLARAILDLMDEYFAGTKKPRMYYQFKMYNDPRLNPELYKKQGTGS